MMTAHTHAYLLTNELFIETVSSVVLPGVLSLGGWMDESTCLPDKLPVSHSTGVSVAGDDSVGPVNLSIAGMLWITWNVNL